MLYLFVHCTGWFGCFPYRCLTMISDCGHLTVRLSICAHRIFHFSFFNACGRKGMSLGSLTWLSSTTVWFIRVFLLMDHLAVCLPCWAASPMTTRGWFICEHDCFDHPLDAFLLGPLFPSQAWLLWPPVPACDPLEAFSAGIFLPSQEINYRCFLSWPPASLRQLRS